MRLEQTMRHVAWGLLLSILKYVFFGDFVQ